MIALLRVDNRLIHGQVLEGWAPRLGARRLVVADDQAAASPLARSAMTLAVPDDLPAEVLAVEAVDWKALAARPEKTLVLFRDVADLARASRRGLTAALAPAVNLGNVHFGPERRPLTPSVFLRQAELDALRDLEAQGFRVEARAVPGDAPVELAELTRRFQRAAG